MGGGQTINVAFSRPELFRYVALMSAGGQRQRRDSAIRPSSRIRPCVNKQFKLFWVGVGKDDTLTGPATRRSTRR